MVHTVWRGIKVVRVRKTPTNPRSSRQQVVRGILAGLSQGFGGLDAANALAWNSFAATRAKAGTFGQFYASGLDAYCELNFFVVDNGDSAATTPPTTAAKGNISTFAAVLGGAAGEIDLTWVCPGGAAAGDMIEISVTAALPNENVKPQKSMWRHKIYLAGNVALYTVTGLTNDAYYGVRARFIMSDGRAGLYQSAVCQAMGT
jgi:hypothetical protein